MQQPAFTPTHLHSVGAAKSDSDLFNALVQKTDNLVTFFEVATDDETWADSHEEFITLTLAWFTEQAYADKLAYDFIKRIASSIHRHYNVLKSEIPRNIIVKFNDRQVRLR